MPLTLPALALLRRRTAEDGPFPSGCRVRFITVPPSDLHGEWLPPGSVVPEGPYVPPARAGPGAQLGQRVRLLGGPHPGNLIAIEVRMTCNGYSLYCAKACGCPIEDCFHLPAKRFEHAICPCGRVCKDREDMMAHRTAVAHTRCCAAAPARKIRRVTPRAHRIGLCAAREVWRSYASAPNTFVRLDSRCRAHGTQPLYSNCYVPTQVKTARALAAKQERWRCQKNWERRRAALLAVAAAAGAMPARAPARAPAHARRRRLLIMRERRLGCRRGRRGRAAAPPPPPPPPAPAAGDDIALRRGMVRLYQGMSDQVLRQVFSFV